MLCCALGQIDTMQVGTSPEQGIMDAARKSAKFCCGLLRKRIGEDDIRHSNEAPDGLQEVDIANRLGWDDFVGRLEDSPLTVWHTKRNVTS